MDNRLQLIFEKLKLLITEYDLLLKENKDIKTLLSQRENELNLVLDKLKESNEEISALNDKISSMDITKSQVSEESIKNKIDELIKEVDQCMEILTD